jgi:hypothetical protein
MSHSQPVYLTLESRVPHSECFFYYTISRKMSLARSTGIPQKKKKKKKPSPSPYFFVMQGNKEGELGKMVAPLGASSSLHHHHLLPLGISTQTEVTQVCSYPTPPPSLIPTSPQHMEWRTKSVQTKRSQRPENHT